MKLKKEKVKTFIYAGSCILAIVSAFVLIDLGLDYLKNREITTFKCEEWNDPNFNFHDKKWLEVTDAKVNLEKLFFESSYFQKLGFAPSKFYIPLEPMNPGPEYRIGIFIIVSEGQLYERALNIYNSENNDIIEDLILYGTFEGYKNDLEVYERGFEKSLGNLYPYVIYLDYEKGFPFHKTISLSVLFICFLTVFFIMRIQNKRNEVV